MFYAGHSKKKNLHPILGLLGSNLDWLIMSGMLHKCLYLIFSLRKNRISNHCLSAIHYLHFMAIIIALYNVLHNHRYINSCKPDLLKVTREEGYVIPCLVFMLWLLMRFQLSRRVVESKGRSFASARLIQLPYASCTRSLPMREVPISHSSDACRYPVTHIGVTWCGLRLGLPLEGES